MKKLKNKTKQNKNLTSRQNMEVVGLRGTGQPCCCSGQFGGGLWEAVIIILSHLFGELQILLFPLSPLLHKHKQQALFTFEVPPQKYVMSPSPFVANIIYLKEPYN